MDQGGGQGGRLGHAKGNQAGGEARFCDADPAGDRQETCDQLVARADAALYEAKNAGRDRFVVAPAVTNSAAWTALRTHP